MRELRVISVDTDGGHVICQDPDNGEKFRIPADEQLRAAARGDLSRLGQIQVTAESALRPREIQAHIRAGATVTEVASMAGVSVDRVERFAHPVLLERSRATEMASASHPIRDDGPANASLGELTDDSLLVLGVNPTETDWDAWKADDGYWVVQLRWHVGHTENYAHWRYLPGAHGGTTDPLDELAHELIHPELVRSRRPLIAVQYPAAPQVEVAPDGHEAVTIDADSLIDGQRDRRSHHRGNPIGADPIDTATAEYPTGEADPADPGPVVLDPENTGSDTADTGSPAADTEGRHRTEPSDTGTPTASGTDALVESQPQAWTPPPGDETEEADATTVSAEFETSVPAESAPQEAAAGEPKAATGDELDLEYPGGTPPADETAVPSTPKRTRKRNKPTVPAWEDVLLGVRSHPNN